jgi:hypothetical protein
MQDNRVTHKGPPFPKSKVAGLCVGTPQIDPEGTERTTKRSIFIMAHLCVSAYEHL